MMPSHSTESQEPRSQETMTFLESLTEDLKQMTPEALRTLRWQMMYAEDERISKQLAAAQARIVQAAHSLKHRYSAERFYRTGMTREDLIQQVSSDGLWWGYILQLFDAVQVLEDTQELSAVGEED